MAQTNIVLADLDREYMSRLETGFIDEFGHTAELSVITDAAYLKRYFSSPRTLDILLINQQIYNQEFAKHNISHLFILTEDTPDPREAGTLYSKMVYKYSSVKEILNCVITRSGISHATNLRTGIAKVIAVFAPVGGAGQTTIAAGLCAALSRNFRRVLYVGLDGLQSFGYLMRSGEQRLAGVEKSVASKSPYAYDKIKPQIVSELFDILPPFPASLASLGIADEHMRYLVSQLRDSGDYDFIVVDCAGDFTANTAKMMAESDNTVLVTLQDALSAHKLKALLDNIDASNSARFTLVCNRFDKKAENALQGLDASLCPPPEYVDADADTDPRFCENLALRQGIQKLGQMFL